MEHIEKDEMVFSNFYKSLKSNGILMISTPSDKGGSDVHENEDHSFIDEHVRDGYGTDEIDKKLKRAGFPKIDTGYTYGWAGSLSWAIFSSSCFHFITCYFSLSLFFLILLMLTAELKKEPDYL
jgi:hypothetical protein